MSLLHDDTKQEEGFNKQEKVVKIDDEVISYGFERRVGNFSFENHSNTLHLPHNHTKQSQNRVIDLDCFMNSSFDDTLLQTSRNPYPPTQTSKLTNDSKRRKTTETFSDQFPCLKDNIHQTSVEFVSMNTFSNDKKDAVGVFGLGNKTNKNSALKVQNLNSLKTFNKHPPEQKNWETEKKIQFFPLLKSKNKFLTNSKFLNINAAKKTTNNITEHNTKTKKKNKTNNKNNNNNNNIDKKSNNKNKTTDNNNNNNKYRTLNPQEMMFGSRKSLLESSILTKKTNNNNNNKSNNKNNNSANRNNNATNNNNNANIVHNTTRTATKSLKPILKNSDHRIQRTPQTNEHFSTLV